MTTSKLRIGLLAPPWVPVPPPQYGGTELVVDQLARGLQDAGCSVQLFTTGDSTCPVRRGYLYERALGTCADGSVEEPHVRAGYDALAGVDVLHDHTVLGPSVGRSGSTPRVTTIHGELTQEMRSHYGAVAASGVRLVAISGSQRRSAPELPVEAVIHHGIDLRDFPVGAGDGDYVVFLGRMSPAKGAHRAIAAARAAGQRIVLAAKMWERDERRYFHECVEPLLGPDAVYVGEVGGEVKLRLLGGATAMLNPIRWPEPFGLVMIEALACGTPVLTFADGAAPEIVDDGCTGYLCDDVPQMAAAVAMAADLDRGACRRAVEERFSTERMVRDHIELYRRMLTTPHGPRVSPDSRFRVHRPEVRPARATAELGRA